MLRRLSFLCLGSLALACPAPPAPVPPKPPQSLASSQPAPRVSPPEKKEPIKLLVLGDNDLHGALDGRSFSHTLADGSTYSMRVGGAEYIAAYYSIVRQQYPGRVVLLAGGDIFQGTPLSNASEGLTTALFLNYLGYDAAAIGNHEFDYGPVGPLSVPREGQNDDAVGALKVILSKATFPFLSANLSEKASGQRPTWENFAQTTTIERAGVNIGIIGLTTESTPVTTQPPNVAALSFSPLAKATEEAAKSLRAGGAEVVLVVAHAGTECKDLSNPKNEDSCNKDEEIYKLLHALPPQTVDAVVAGHTHQFIANFIAGTPVIESNANGTAFGRIELSFDPNTRSLRRDETKIFPPQSVCREVYVGTGRCDPRAAKESSGKTEPATFYGVKVEPDTKVTELLREARASVESVNQEVLGEVARPITRGEKGESEMGNLVTDLMRAYTKQDKAIKDADFAVQNGGGLRADLSAGTLRYGALFEVLPFENVLVTVQLSGAQVRALFEAALSTGRVFHVSGLKIVYQSTPKAGVTPKAKFDFDDYTHTLLRIETEKGKPLDEKKTYVMVWNDFLANGGDGTKGVIEKLPSGAVERHYNATLRDSAAALLRKNKEPLNGEKAPLLDPKKPRIVFEIKK